MKKIIFLLLISFHSFSQNLVINPSFEDTIPCTAFINNNYPRMPCNNWYWGTGGSTDYFSEQYLCISSPAPSNVFGNQMPRTGIAYCGFGLYHNTISSFEYREYLGGQLTDTLISGHNYCISFYIVKADTGKFYTSNIGLYLSSDSSVNYNNGYALPYIPQIVNTNGIIYDTLNWTPISGTYLAQGGEKYLMIGNFNDDANTILDSNSQTEYLNRFAYYFIDDVSVTDCTVGINNINPATTQTKLYPNPTKQTQVYYTCTLAANQTGNLQVTDMLGNILATYNLNSGSNKITINTAAYTKGVYVVKVNVVGRAGESLKLVVQ